MTSPRRIAVITTARSDYGIYRPLLRAIEADPALTLQLVVGAGHLDPRFGTVAEIEADGFSLAARVEAPMDGDGALSIAGVMGAVTSGMAAAFDRLRPDLIVALGDRSEMAAAVAGAVPFLIPVAHIAGGAITRGAIDDGFRHAISKLSQIHFPETELQKQRLLRLGEEEWRIHVTGSLSIDNVLAIRPVPLSEIAARFAIALDTPPLLVTLHPETRDFVHTARHIAALLAALDGQDTPILFTYPGADAHGRIIIDAIETFVRTHPGSAFAVPHLGTQAYFSLMTHARAMIGNSSSGVIEAASFRLPVVNVGNRQEGRMTPVNVLHCAADADAIRTAIAKALSLSFRAQISSLQNPYGDGRAARRMTDVLKSVPLNATLINKAAF